MDDGTYSWNYIVTNFGYVSTKIRLPLCFGSKVQLEPNDRFETIYNKKAFGRKPNA